MKEKIENFDMQSVLNDTKQTLMLNKAKIDGQLEMIDILAKFIKDNNIICSVKKVDENDTGKESAE